MIHATEKFSGQQPLLSPIPGRLNESLAQVMGSMAKALLGVS
jgi:hypothetical protein